MEVLSAENAAVSPCCCIRQPLSRIQTSSKQSAITRIDLRKRGATAADATMLSEILARVIKCNKRPGKISYALPYAPVPSMLAVNLGDPN
jgi:hypothetical protein